MKIVLEKAPFLQQTRDYLSRLQVQPSKAWATALNTFVGDCIKDGNWLEFDELNIHATEKEQHSLINLVFPSSPIITKINSPTFSANQGWTGASGHYLDHNKLATAYNKFTRNSGSMGFYSRTNSNDSGVQMGFRDAGTTVQFLIFPRNGGNLIAKCGSNTNVTGAVGDSLGLFAAVRKTSARQEIWKRGVMIASDTVASVATPAIRIFSTSYSFDNSPTGASVRQQSMTFIGSGNIDQAKLETSFTRFATSIGFNV